MTHELNDLLNYFLLRKETESFLQATLRPGKLFKDSLKLSELTWSSHWIWNRSLGMGEVHALYVGENKGLYMRKIEREDLLGRNLTIEDVYKALKNSKAKKTRLDLSTILTG